MTSRRRSGRSKDDIQDALNEFEDIKRGSKKRKVVRQRDVLEEVDEKEYEELVNERRKSNFIVEDEEEGNYDDNGEEWWERNTEKKKTQRTARREKGIFNVSTAPRKSSLSPKKGRNKISAALKRGSTNVKEHFDLGNVEIDKLMSGFTSTDSGVPSASDLLSELTKDYGTSTKSAKEEIKPDAESSKGVFNNSQLESGITISEGDSAENYIVMKEDESDKPDSETHAPSEVALSNVIDPETGCLHIFWLDVSEQRESGVLNVIGKVKKQDDGAFVSACLTVNDVDRSVLFVPRRHRFDVSTQAMTNDPVTLEETAKEIQTLFRRMGVMQLRMKVVEKKAWDDGMFGEVFSSGNAEADGESDEDSVTHELKCLEVRYSGNAMQLSPKIHGETFCRVFNKSASKTERFLLEKNLHGPCWLKVKSPKDSARQNAWTSLKIQVPSLQHIEVLEEAPPPPPLSMMCMRIETILNMQKKTSEILMVTYIIFKGIDIEDVKFEGSAFITLMRPTENGLPDDFHRRCQGTRLGGSVRTMDSERGLLSYLLAAMKKYDPDIICGHELFGISLDALLNRMRDMKIEGWSKLGRIRRSMIPNFNKPYELSVSDLLRGRIVVDTFHGAKENIRCNSYKLEALATDVLNTSFKEYSTPETLELLRTTDCLISFIDHSRKGCVLVIELMKKMQLLSLTLQLTKLVGNLWSRTLAGGRNERNEMLLLHRFHNLGYILPEKYRTRQAMLMKEDDEGKKKPEQGKRRKAQYEGGLVLEPKVGFYSKMILLLDFNSLYPSIIQENNICFTTVSILKQGGDQDDDDVDHPEDMGADFVGKTLPTKKEKGVLPKVVEELIERRKEVKKLMNDPKTTVSQREQRNIRQLALKLTANSLYGCLGFEYSRFYAKELARLITAKGREALVNARDLAQEMGLEVVYGDTDSIMVNTDTNATEEVLKIANLLKEQINKKYRKLEIDVDGIFSKFLLLKKKKYAAIILEKRKIPHTGEEKWMPRERMEVKGIDMVRRDWCDLSKEVSENILNILLKQSDDDNREVFTDIHGYLRDVYERLKQDEISHDKFQIRKVLKRHPREYADMKNQPHVFVASRLMGMKKPIRVGNVISYVVCEGVSQHISEKSYTLEEVRNNPNLNIDIKWYIENQILPPVQRICEPLNETNATLLAECFGIQSRSSSSKANEEGDKDNKDLKFPFKIRW